MSPDASEEERAENRFPRVSGDEPPDMPGVNEQTVFSPRERG